MRGKKIDWNMSQQGEGSAIPVMFVWEGEEATQQHTLHLLFSLGYAAYERPNFSSANLNEAMR
jgi:hypothetical protein